MKDNQKIMKSQVELARARGAAMRGEPRAFDGGLRRFKRFLVQESDQVLAPAESFYGVGPR